MNISHSSSRLQESEEFRIYCAPETKQNLAAASGSKYLESIADLALQPTLTSTIFAIHDDISVDICGRWMVQSEFDQRPLEIVAALAQTLPFSPHLLDFVLRILQEKPSIFQRFSSLDFLLDDTKSHRNDIQIFLLTLIRLIHFERDLFTSLVSPAHLPILLQHSEPSIRYLSARLLNLYFSLSEVQSRDITDKYVGQQRIDCDVEGRLLNLTFWDLWEGKRISTARQLLDIDKIMCFSKAPIIKTLSHEDFVRGTTLCGSVLLPALGAEQPQASKFVQTTTTLSNLHKFARAVRGSRCVLLSGPAESGKRNIVQHAARILGKQSKMTTLHLNEQSDFKSLLGLYSNDETSNVFRWQPGCLTRAVQSGYWVLIEDLDRAPREIVAALLSLVERGELHIASQGSTIKAASGFKLLATTRTNNQGHLHRIKASRGIMGMQHWTRVLIDGLTDNDVLDIVKERFPQLRSIMPRIVQLYHNMNHNTEDRHGAIRVDDSSQTPVTRRFLRWCSRIARRVGKSYSAPANNLISEVLTEHLFLEALDVFGSNYPATSEQRRKVAKLCAESLGVSPTRSEYCVFKRRPKLHLDNGHMRLGRVEIERRQGQISGPRSSREATDTFAFTDPTLRVLESLGATIAASEPCLLIGETGVGKTRSVQQLAQMTNTKLNVMNLSQQSDVVDLIGGYKPANMKSLVIPLKEDFEDLFYQTFSKERNEHFVQSVAKAICKRRYLRAISLWHEALAVVKRRFNPQTAPEIADQKVQPSKRRRLGPKSLTNIKKRWIDFELRVDVLRKQLKSRAKGFAFSFMPGKLVKAAQAGEWMLLDEINLAPPDTLESISDLLGESNNMRSLFLTEKEGGECILVHQNFRLFAAMNPANDVGKRDLPYAVRSRFTEIHIESPDRDIGALAQLVQAYLGCAVEADPAIAVDISQTYLSIKQLQEARALTDGSGQPPHFSLRNLTRALQFIQDSFYLYGLRRATYEGFCMAFSTTLGKESDGSLRRLLEAHILPRGKANRALMTQNPRKPSDTMQYKRFQHYWVPLGSLPPKEQPHYVITPFIDAHLKSLVRATMSRRFPILLQGPTSSGKTSMVEYLASLSGNRFIRVNNHEQTDIQEYTGTYTTGNDGSLQFRDGVLVNALREGYWIVLDELNLASSDVLEALNRLLDDNRELLVPETQEIIRPHPNFMLFATQNPSGTYGGRKPLSRAFRNRFLEIHFDEIPISELEAILRERSSIAPSFCTRIVVVYERLTKIGKKNACFEGMRNVITLRDLFRWASRDVDTREKLAHQGFMLLAERVRNVEGRQLVREVIEEVTKVNIDITGLYERTPSDYPVSHATGSKQPLVATRSARRLYKLVTEALKNHEPVLLIGESGVGKTRLCQELAQNHGRQLITVNAHQNLETGDLIGSQRPLRQDARMNEELARDLSILLEGHEALEATGLKTIEQLINEYNTLKLSHSLISPDIDHASLEYRIARHKARFEWSDGPLIRSMKAGQYFLMDEIALAEDAVLERLNSVLETSRSIYLAEKGAEEGPVVASENFQFLATMNPGGDYGKRELSPALRNRFTEIWVPPISDRDEYREIVEAALLPHWRHLAERMVDFSAWYAAQFRSQRSSTLLRDLLAWSDFLNQASKDEESNSILHGASMVHMESLKFESSAFSTDTDSNTSIAEEKCLKELARTFEIDTRQRHDKPPLVTISSDGLVVGGFVIEKPASAIQGSDRGFCFDAPTTKANLLKLARALRIPKSILLEGSPGVGKTTLVEATAAKLGVPLVRLNLSEQTDLTDLFGSEVPLDDQEAGQFGWRDAPFLRAMQNGQWVLLDEMNLASQAVLEGLNACLDHRGQVFIPELNQTFDRHQDFKIFAAQNPRRQGGGRKGLPESFVNRFTPVFFDRLAREDMLMVCSHAFRQIPYRVVEEVVDTITALDFVARSNLAGLGQAGLHECNLRDAMRWLQLLASQQNLGQAECPADFYNIVFKQRLRTVEESNKVSAMIPNYAYNKVGTTSLYISPAFVQCGVAILQRSSLITLGAKQSATDIATDRSRAESILLCLEQNWPCLLVGPSGSGKSLVISQMAALIGTRVKTISMNTDTDTGELIGTYEHLNRQRHVSRFVSRLRSNVRDQLYGFFRQGLKWPQPLLDLWYYTKTNEIDPSYLVTCLETYAEKVQDEYMYLAVNEAKTFLVPLLEEPQFEWVDGELVEAMQHGDWLVLDNANLCDPSVLDRLNSLLEPNGHLSISEQRLPDGSMRIVRPHTDFRLFLTVDPIHGELSRAMRNRSVELFFPPTNRQKIFNDTPGLDSRGVLYKSFSCFDWNALNEVRFSALFVSYLDHIPIASLPASLEWLQDVTRGMSDLDVSRLSLLSSLLTDFYHFWESRQLLLSQIRKTYVDVVHELSHEGLEVASFEYWQPIHPLNNPALLRLAPERQGVSYLQYLGDIVDTAARAHKLTEKINASKAALTVPRVGFHSLDPGEQTLGLTELLESFPCAAQSYVEVFESCNRRRVGRFEVHQVACVNRLLSWFSALLTDAESHHWRQDIIRSFLSLGRDLINEHLSVLPETPAGKRFHDMFDTVDKGWRLTRGLGMELLWDLFKVPSVSGVHNDDVTIMIEKLGWPLGVRLRELTFVYSLLYETPSIRDEGMHGSCYTPEERHVKQVQEAISKIQLHCGSRKVSRKPFMARTFEMLRQCYSTLYSMSAADSCKVPLEVQLLSMQPIKRPPPKTSDSLPLIILEDFVHSSGLGNPETCLSNIREILPLQILANLEDVPQVPLGATDLLQEELETLGIATAKLTDRLPSDGIQLILDKLASLIFIILDSHKHIVPAAELQTQWDQLRKCCPQALSCQRPGDTHQPSQIRSANKSHQIHYAQDILCRYLRPAAFCIEDATTSLVKRTRGSAITSTARAITLFFVGCISLYLPDKEFDPAMKSIVEHEWDAKEIVATREHIEALVHYERVSSGQDSNYRISLERSRLQLLRGKWHKPPTARPKESSPSHMQSEFDSIYRNIISKLANKDDVLQLIDVDAHQSQIVQLLREGIASSLSRITANSQIEPYVDVSRPLIAMLQGLEVGLTLATVRDSQGHDAPMEIRTIARLTPFMSLRPADLRSFEDWTGNGDPSKRVTRLVRVLELVSLKHRIEGKACPPTAQKQFDIFKELYSIWKAQLTSDRAASAEKSAMYRYRGSQEQQDCSEQQEVQDLFPSGDDSEVPISNSKHSTDIDALSEQISWAHHLAYSCPHPPESMITTMMQKSSIKMAKLRHQLPDMTLSPLLMEDLLPIVIKQLDQSCYDSTVTSTAQSDANFYHDANVHEAKRLMAIMISVRSRFKDMQEAWPEHETIQEVLRLGDELLDLKQSLPLAGLITKVEQVHVAVHQWQSVASRQYTVQDLCDILSTLLIDWRRLELRSWNSLLDREEQNASKSVASWFFIAYEAVVSEPISILEEHGSFEQYSQSLYTTLEEFIYECPNGQFTGRLRLLEDLYKQWQSIQGFSSRVTELVSMLSHFIAYYSSYGPLIIENMQKGREACEKELKEVLLLASWKDTNINAMRESAKRSHTRLFKVVKKYRSLLSEPVRNILMLELPYGVHHNDNCATLTDPISLNSYDESAFELCSHRLPGWDARPARFTNAQKTVERMRKAIRSSNATFEVASVLSTYRNDLVTDIKALQKATSAVLTPENAAQAKYLQTRKRKLLADTLKSIHRMGFRSNLASDIIAKQDTLGKIFLQVPVDPVCSKLDANNDSNVHFYKALDVVFRFKNQTRKPSEELGSGDVARIKGFTESMLHNLIQGRHIIGTATSRNLRLSNTIQSIKRLWMPDEYQLANKHYHSVGSIEETQRIIAWLQPIVCTAQGIVIGHGKLADMDHGDTQTQMETWLRELLNIDQILTKLPQLPRNVTSSMHQDCQKDCEKLIRRVREEAIELMQRHPHLRFVLRQVEVWAAPHSVENNQVDANGSRPSTIFAIEQLLSKALDTILVAIQRTKFSVDAVPDNEKEQGWLISAHHGMSSVLKSLHIAEIDHLLEKVLTEMNGLNNGDTEGLQLAGALVATSLPLLREYQSIISVFLQKYKSMHDELCRLAIVTAENATHLLSRGFCSPKESSNGDESQSGKMEGGTGLGEGEGIEDISKSIGDDEDLSELAQSNQQAPEEEGHDGEDAVNMDREDMEGTAGETEDVENNEVSDQEDGSEQSDMDEEVGTVDDLDPSAVDEKMWEGGEDPETNKPKKESANAPGQPRDSDQNEKHQGEKQKDGKETTEMSDQVSQGSTGTNEVIMREEHDQVDPHLNVNDHLDLPLDIDLDQDEKSSVTSGLSDMDDLGSAKEHEEPDGDLEDIEAGEAEKEKENPQSQAEHDELTHNDTEDSAEQDDAKNDESSSVVDTDPDNDDDVEMEDAAGHTSADNFDQNAMAPSDAQGVGGDLEQAEKEEIVSGQAGDAKLKGQDKDIIEGIESTAESRGEQNDRAQTSSAPNSSSIHTTRPSKVQEAFRALGNALEEWHRQARHIQEASDDPLSRGQKQQTQGRSAEMQYEHLPNEDAESDAQALGNATEEQAQAFDDQAMAHGLKETKSRNEFPIDESSDEDMDEENRIETPAQRMHKEVVEGDMEIPERIRNPMPIREQRRKHPDAMDIDDDEEAELIPDTEPYDRMSAEPNSPPSSSFPQDPQAQYYHDMQVTSSLAFQLIEKLRLILNPTHATKYRGGYKSGNRLNMKAVMRFYASNFREDKIFMRRSVPQKRGYQVMICIDDSRSMRDSSSAAAAATASHNDNNNPTAATTHETLPPSDAGTLALQSLALVTKSLTMLESGEICVLGFGDTTTVHCPFQEPWSDAKGVDVWRSFTFQQPRTNVRNLLQHSLELFREARRNSRAAAGGQDLWQLQLIVSDGVCEDHEAIRRLVTRAVEERIMIIFVIVDAVNRQTGKGSILEMTQAVFEEVGEEEKQQQGQDGEGGRPQQPRLTIKRYLDDFPFAYYPVVGDVRELPNVLATALRQWFSEVAENY